MAGLCGPALCPGLVLLFVLLLFSKQIQTVYCGSSILEKKELATLTGRAPQLCGWALWPGSVSGPCPPLCPPLVLQTDPNSLLWQFDLREKRTGHTHWPRPSTLWLGSVARLCVPGLVLLFVLLLFSKQIQTVYCGSSVLEKKELATLTGRAPQLCGWALWPGSVSGPCPPLCPPLVLQTDPNSLLWQFDLREKRAGHTHWPRPSTLWLGSVARLCVRALSSSLSSSCSPTRSKQFTVAVRS